MNRDFVRSLRSIAQESGDALKERERVQFDLNSSRLSEKFEELKEKYDLSIQDVLRKRASIGKLDAYMNMEKTDFEKTGMGTPKEVAEQFLSFLIPKDCGIEYEVWNNRAFTVKFTFDGASEAPSSPRPS